MKNFVFIDVFTQKLFGENFGSKAIFGVSEIRENLMNISALVIEKNLRHIAIKTTVEDFSESDLECMMDTEIDSAKTNYSKDDKQILIQKDSIQSLDFIQEIESYLLENQIETVFLYGLPFEEVINLGLRINQLDIKTWIVIDGTKSSNSNEREEIKTYQKEGLKVINFRNLEKYLEM